LLREYKEIFSDVPKVTNLNRTRSACSESVGEPSGVAWGQ